MNKILISALGVSTLTIASLVVSTSAQALTLSSKGNTCSLSDLDVSIACEGAFKGNDSANEINSHDSGNGLFGFNNWTQYAKVDGSSGTDLGLTVNGGGTSGTWSLTGIDFNSFNVMAVLKGGPTFSAYLLDSAGPDWSTDGILKGNLKAGPDLSHFTIYISAKPVPEPLTILGTGLALGLGGLFKSKQKQKFEA